MREGTEDMENQNETSRGAYVRTRWATVMYGGLAAHLIFRLLLLAEPYLVFYILEIAARFLAVISFFFSKVRKKDPASRALFKIDVAYLIFSCVLSLAYLFWVRSGNVRAGSAWGTFFSVASIVTHIADILCAASLFFIFQNRTVRRMPFVAAWVCLVVWAVFNSLLNGNGFHLSVWETPGLIVYVLAAVLGCAWIVLLSLCKEDRTVGGAVSASNPESERENKG